MAKNKPARKPEKQVKSLKEVAVATPTSTGVIMLVAGIAAAVLGFLLYANTFGYYYALDDYSLIKDNWVVKGGIKNIGIIFTTEYRFGTWNSPGSLFRPIPLTMFALEWQLSPDKPWISHLMNVVFYSITGWALWITWRRVLGKYPPVLALLAVLLYIAHPVHTEVVANIKSRDEILGLLFSTLALYAIWRHFDNNDKKWLVWAAVSYGVAMFSKEGSIMFIFLFPLTMWYFSEQSIGKIIKTTAVMLIPVALFLLVRRNALGGQQYQEIYSILDNFMVGAKSQSERLASAFMMCWEYLKVLVYPATLVSDRGYPQLKPVGFGEWRAIAGFLIYLAMGLWALWKLPKKHVLSFAIFFYLICYSIFSNVFFLIGTSYGERLLYLPSFGFALATAWAIVSLLKINDMSDILNPDKKGTQLWTIAGILLSLYSIRTILRNPTWENSASLYASDLPNSPDCTKLNYHNALEVARIAMDEKTGAVKDRAGLERAVECYTKCITLYPEYHDAYGSRGIAYFRLGQYDKAFDDYQVSIKYRPNNATVLSNMGFIYFMRGQLEKAEEVYKESIKWDPRFVDARRNLGAVLAMKKRFPEAIEQWEEGLKYDPQNATLLLYIGSAYRDMGQPEKGVPWFEKAYAIDPTLKK